MSFSLVSKERIRLYDAFKRQIDQLNKNESSLIEFLSLLSDRPANSYWIVTSYWGTEIVVRVELRKDEKLSEQGALIERFEALFGEILKTEDDVSEYSMVRNFYTKRARLRIDVPGDSMTCKRVEIESSRETVTHKKYRIECQEALTE